MSDFELVEYANIGRLKVPLVMGTCNNGKWSFEGVLTSEDVDVKLMMSLFDHMYLNRGLHDTQTLFTIVYDIDDEAYIVRLKALGIQERDADIQGEPDVPQLPIGFGKVEHLSEIHTYFTGEHTFHENYPQFMDSLEPFAALLQKLIEGRA